MPKYYTLYATGKIKSMPSKIKIGDKFFPIDKNEWKRLQIQELREHKKFKKIK